MSTEFFNNQWRIPSNENQNKISNYSMEFDGTNDLINIGSQTFNNNHSVSFWIYSSPTILYGGILSSGANSISLDQGGGAVGVGKFYFRISNVNYTVSSTLLVAATWSHVVFTRNGTNVYCYINGLLDKTTTVPAYSTWQYIGVQTPSTGFNNFTGKLDQFTIFDYELSAAQVSTLHGGGTAVTNPMALSPKPIAYYQLGDQSVSTGPSADYLVPNNSLQDYVFNLIPSDYISFANGSTMARQQNISYSAWVNTTNLSTTQYIVGNNLSSNQGTSIFLINTASYPDRLIFQFGDIANFNNQSYFNSIVSNLSTYVSANEWFHVAASWDGTTSKIYINGIERNSWTPTQPPAYTIYNWGSFRIGRRGDSAGSYFNGMLSNVAFWDNGLTPSQVTTLYNNGSPATDISSLSPVSWWKLNAQDTFDGTIWTIKDYAGSNDGTSNGMTSANLITSDLQHTSGYSPYALSLDGANDYLKLNNTLNNSILFGQTSFTISAWIYLSSINTPANNPVISNLGNNAARQSYMLRVNNLRNIEISVITTTGSFDLDPGNGSFEFDKWEHITLTLENQELKCYLNGSQVGSTLTNVSGSVVNSVGEGYIGARGTGVTNQVFGGNLSNIAVWQGSAQNPVTLYNNGVPGDLTSLNPSAWWQLGSNSSFDTNWTCLNEGSLTGFDAVSVNMVNDDIVNGVGYSANGLGTSSIDIVGDAPYSTANGLSENMDVLDRTTDVPG